MIEAAIATVEVMVAIVEEHLSFELEPGADGRLGVETCRTDIKNMR